MSRQGSAMKCPLPVVRYRVIRAKVCVAEGNVQFLRLSSLRHMELSRKVCVAEVWNVACPFSVLRYTVCEVKVCVAAGLSYEMPPSRRAIQGNSCKSVCRAAKCAVSAPFLPATHGIVSKSVCRGRRGYARNSWPKK